MRRTVLVAVLMSAAVCLPLAAWWIGGSRQVDQDARTLAGEAAREDQNVMDESAHRLADRLLTLRAEENVRPFYHYRNLYHEPEGATRGLSIIPSPLSKGALNPLVGVYFQIEASGEISLPTVNEQFPELSTEEGYATYCAFLEQMENGLVIDNEESLMPEHRLVELDAFAWRQIEAANEVYADLITQKAGAEGLGSSGSGGPEHVVIGVGLLRWHTILTASGPLLAALRQVETPSGVLVQGFTISSIAATPEASGINFVSSLEPAKGSMKIFAPVAYTGWYLLREIEDADSRNEDAANVLVTQFRRRFSFAALAAVFAALFVIVIVAQADRLARQRTRFAAAAAHELKTPLASLRLYSEMLAEGLGDHERRSSYASRIAEEASRLGRVVTNILDLSRLERGAQLAQPEIGNLVPIVRLTVEGLRKTLEEAGIEVDFHVEQPVLEVLFDKDAVCQILGNFLDNAERYTRGVEGRRVEILVNATGKNARIVVADNGPGVSKAYRRRIFSPFVRRQVKNGPTGLGLGLALARSLARAQGGDVFLDDANESGGATFVLILALA